MTSNRFFASTQEVPSYLEKKHSEEIPLTLLLIQHKFIVVKQWELNKLINQVVVYIYYYERKRIEEISHYNERKSNQRERRRTKILDDKLKQAWITLQAWRSTILLYYTEAIPRRKRWCMRRWPSRKNSRFWIRTW